MSTHVLTLGALNLNGGTGPGWRIDAEGDDADFGNAQPIEAAIRSLLQDGSIVVTQGHDNTEAFFRVTIEADDSLGLEAGRAALVAEVGRPNLLSWQHPDGLSPVRVYEVHTSSLAHVFDDWEESEVNRMVFGIRLVRMPWARAEAKTVIPALTSAVSLTTTLIDACSALTGWTAGLAGTTATLTGGSTRVQTSNSLGFSAYIRLTKTFTAINMTTTPYITVRVGFTSTVDTSFTPASPHIRVAADGTFLLEVHRIRVSTGSVNVEDRTYYCPDTSITSIIVDGQVVAAGILYVDNINRLNQVPFTGTARQKARTIDIGGTVRTPGSLSIQHATSGLGDVLCYISPDDGTGYRPDLRVRRTGGGAVTADANQVSGSTEDINTLATFAIPLVDLPAGPYSLMARVAKITTTTARTVVWTAQVQLGGILMGPVLTGTARIPTSGAGVWEIHDFGHMILPTLATPATSEGLLVLTLDEQGGGLSFDEGWLFDTKRGQLVWVACGAGIPAPGTVHNRMWINSPTIDEPRPQVFIGTEADQGDAHYPSEDFGSWELPTFNPGVMRVHTVTTGALDADVAFEHYERLG